MKSYPSCDFDPSIETGKISYIHGEKISSSSAFDYSVNSEIRLMLPRALGVNSVFLELLCESCEYTVKTQELVWDGIVDNFDVYSFGFNAQSIDVGLYYFKFIINTQQGSYFGFRGNQNTVCISSNEEGRLFQLSISRFKFKAPGKKLGGVIYHIFVDRFNRTKNRKVKPGCVIVDDWSNGVPEYPDYPGAPLKNNTFYGGTLDGIREKLDYISSLGVNTIYLSPIFDAPSNHKYDTSDYMTVDEMFGGEEALVRLINEASKYKIGIILDGVFNHTGADSIYFNKYGSYNSLGAYQSKDSKYYPWFDFKNYPDQYTCWWGIEILPRIHPSVPECEEYFVGKDGVIDHYSKLGIDGFRLDVVDELSDIFVSKIKKRLNDNNKNSILYGEVWEDASCKIAYGTRKKYYLGDELDGVMNYPIRKGIIDFLCHNKTEALEYALTDIINNAPKRIRDVQMNLLGTHDTERILTVLGGESSKGYSNEYLSTRRMNADEYLIGRKRLIMAYTILATVPGIPSIYYGDEVGLEGYHDPFNRMPFPWGKEDMLLLEHYRSLGKLRKTKSVYKDGEFSLLHLDECRLLFLRYNEKGNKIITFVNNSNKKFDLYFDGKAKQLIPCVKCIRNNKLTIDAYSASVIEANEINSIEF